MGGSGSGRWVCHRKKRAVDSCACMQVKPGGQVSLNIWGGSWRVTQEKQGEYYYLLLNGSLNGWTAQHWIRIEYWKPRFGGRSLFLLCPGCGRRCRKLYAPPGMADYQCRICWKLAYTSSQEAHRWDRGALIGMLCAATGASPREIKKAMRADFKTQRETDRRGRD